MLTARPPCFWLRPQNIYDSHPKCDHEHHPKASPKQTLTPIQTRAPAQMQLWTKHNCEPNANTSLNASTPTTISSMKRATTQAPETPAINQMHWQCTLWLAISAEMVLGRGHAAWTGWGEDLLKGRGDVSTLLSPSYFYIVGIPSHVNIFLVDKEYILHWHLPRTKDLQRKKISTQGWASQWHAIIYVRHIQMCQAQVQSTH